MELDKTITLELSQAELNLLIVAVNLLAHCEKVVSRGRETLLTTESRLTTKILKTIMILTNKVAVLSDETQCKNKDKGIYNV